MMFNGRGPSTIGWAQGMTCLIGATFALGGCGESKSLGEETGGDSATGGSVTETGTGGTGGGSDGGAGVLGGTGGAGTGGAGKPEVPLDGIGGYYSPDQQEASAGKLDLLFVVDNSISMADKQQILSLAVPGMVERLVNPRCLDSAGNPVANQPTSGLDTCPAGSTRELVPVRDLHVGVLSSSLGAHGGVVCSPEAGDNYSPEQNDNGQLIASTRGLESHQGQGFLAWDAQSDLSGFIEDVRTHVEAVGENGCGYEATLESWYRFLVDPEPPLEVTKVGDVLVKGGINDTVLNQRAAFLRPESSVAIVLLSDENDCSIRDDGVSWVVTDQRTTMPRGTSACLENPNDPCCRSCALAEVAPPAGCVALGQDPHCSQPAYSGTEEPPNLRCWDQQRRFGIDFLYPTDRYVRALTHQTIFRDSDGREVENPLFAGGLRNPSMVTLVGIVGVPWQALARTVREDLPLRYKPASQLHGEGTWQALIGDPHTNEPPEDPFMIESVFPRSGTSPITGYDIQPPSSVSNASPVNGHEYDQPNMNDLQYACIFPLLTPRDCVNYSGGCDCRQDSPIPNNPLCQMPGTTTATTTQYAAKAYPGLRHLEVLRRIGPLAVPASICPRVATDLDDPEFGYNPVVEAMIDRLGDTLE